MGDEDGVGLMGWNIRWVHSVGFGDDVVVESRAVHSGSLFERHSLGSTKRYLVRVGGIGEKSVSGSLDGD